VRAWLIVFAAQAGCTTTGRLEVGLRKTIGHDVAVRVGVSIGVGFANPKATRSVTQSLGYRYCENHSLSTATRALAAAGPLYLSGAIEIDNTGFDLAPALLVPLLSSVKSGPDSSIFPGSGAHARTRTERSFYPVGLQLRGGRHDGEYSMGADLVLGFDGLTGSSDPE
jgi:hypothetical protein